MLSPDGLAANMLTSTDGIGVLNDECCWVDDNPHGRESIRMDETTHTGNRAQAGNHMYATCLQHGCACCHSTPPGGTDMLEPLRDQCSGDILGK